MNRALSSLIRHVLTFTGGAGMVSDDDVTQIASALAALLGIAWSLLDKWLAVRAAEAARNNASPPSPLGPTP